MSSQPDKNLTIASGVVLSSTVAVLIVGATKFIGAYFDVGSNSLFIFSTFIIIPFLMGFICAYCWRSLQMKISGYIIWSIATTLIACLLSAVFLREGAICLLIVSPLILLFVVAGALTGRIVFHRKNNTLNLSLLGVLFFIYVADAASEHENTTMISDTLIIQAPVDKVWPYVVAYEPIKIEETYWLFKAGMPSPIQSTVDGYAEGAGRKCIFSNGYVFDEKMVVYKPNEELTFDIVQQPLDPEIMGHIDIVRGQFILKDNGDGTTTLIGNSWYKLYVFPTWYFNLWSDSITRAVHFRVMEHIKILSEKDV
jgi:hypothetical protein